MEQKGFPRTDDRRFIGACRGSLHGERISSTVAIENITQNHERVVAVREVAEEVHRNGHRPVCDRFFRSKFWAKFSSCRLAGRPKKITEKGPRMYNGRGSNTIALQLHSIDTNLSSHADKTAVRKSS